MSRALGWFAVAGLVAGCQQETPKSKAPPVEVARQAEELGLSTVLVGVKVRATRVATVEFAAKKQGLTFSPQAAAEGNADLRVETVDAVLGVRGKGEATVPPLCTCKEEKPHYVGDVELAHETTVLVRAPYATGREELRVYLRGEDGEWKQVLSAGLSEVAR